MRINIKAEQPWLCVSFMYCVPHRCHIYLAHLPAQMQPNMTQNKPDTMAFGSEANRPPNFPAATATVGARPSLNGRL
jgi:hypothetical protein